MKQLHKNSYDILRNRITDRGYAVTSLTGLYIGMFPRDSSIQAMAHIAHGDSFYSRRILRYLLSYHVALDLKRTTHIIENIEDREYRNNYLNQNTPRDIEYFIADRRDEQDIYLLNAPNNRAAQSFTPLNDLIYGVDVSLTKTYDSDSVTVEISEDYKDPSSTIAKTTYTFKDTPSGWQHIAFDSAVKVTPYKTYYLIITADENSGRVVWRGCCKGHKNYVSCNFDLPCFGGWETKHYVLSYEIISYPYNSVINNSVINNTVIKEIAPLGNYILGSELCLFSKEPKGRVKIDIRNDPLDEKTSIGSAEVNIDFTGQKTVSVTFDKKIPVSREDSYYAVIDITGNSYAKILTEPRCPANTFSLIDGKLSKIGYDLVADLFFDTDKLNMAEIDGNSSIVQEIPSNGERITAVKLLLSKSENSKGSIKATLLKGEKFEMQTIDTKTITTEELSTSPDWISVKFDLPLTKTRADGRYYVKLDGDILHGKVYWCGTDKKGKTQTFCIKDGITSEINGTLGYNALTADFGLISNFTQTDANYMLIHAWAKYVNNNENTSEDIEFINDSYPVICSFANYYFDTPGYYNEEMSLILSPSLEHSRLGRYWIAYDLITNVFASQALYELSKIANKLNDKEGSERFMRLSHKIRDGIHTKLVTEADGKKIYAEFYDAEDNMKFYPGISWVNMAPIAAEWYAMDMDIMKNTYDIYKKHGAVNMYGYDCPASEADLGGDNVTPEMIGKCIAWEMMFCRMIGDEKRLDEIIEIELETSKRNGNTVYPECWRSEDFVTDPGNQEHCGWQVYAAAKVFPEFLQP